MKNKVVLIVMIVLFLISSACAGYGFYIYMDKKNHPPAENPNKNFKFDGKLYFYDKNKELIGKYTCSFEYCGYARNMIDDSSYNTKYYKDASMTEIPLVNNRYAFISDNANKNSESLILFDVVNNKVVKNLTGVKNYSIGINNDYFIVRDENVKWGVMKLNNNAGTIVDFKYDYIGLNARIDAETALLKGDSFITLDTNGWKVISDSGADISSYFIYQIHDYNDSYVITSSGNNYYLNFISGDQVNTENNKGMEFIDNYLKIYDTNGQCYLINLFNMTDASARYNVSSIDELKTVRTINGIEIYLGDDLQETVVSNTNGSNFID